ncbi:hypothetical protein BDW75DRAFT_225743, partial [Aspergillus navahoensis]
MLVTLDIWHINYAYLGAKWAKWAKSWADRPIHGPTQMGRPTRFLSMGRPMPRSR